MKEQKEKMQTLVETNYTPRGRIKKKPPRVRARQSSGITLVALVVSIVVMLILARCIN